MAAIEYVDNTIGAGDNDGTTWANAWRDANGALEAALASCDAGGKIYVQSDHTEANDGANLVLTSANGVAANPVTIISVTNTNEPPDPGDYQTMMTGGGSMDTTDGVFDITFGGWDIWIGFHFKIGDDFFSVDSVDCRFFNCKFEVADIINIGDRGTTAIYFEDVDIEQITPGNFVLIGSLYWKGGSYSFNGGSTASLFDLSAVRGGNVIVEDVDIQDLDGGDYLVSDTLACHDVLIKRCKIPGACNYMNSGPTGGASRVRFHSVDDGNFIYKFYEWYFEGQILENIAIYRSATYDGTNEYSAQMVANKGNTVAWSRPLRFKLADIWCAANPTLTIHFNLDQAATIQNNELWFEIEYPDDTTGALGSLDQTSRPANILTAAGDQGNAEGDPGGWTEAFANPQARSKAITIANGQAGIHTIWACLAKEATVYVCPKIDVS